MVINGTGSEYGKAIRDVERKQIMWRKNKAEHINGGEGLKEVFIWMSREGRNWRQWNITLRRYSRPLSWGKNGEHWGCYNRWVWCMLPIGWNGRLQHWDMMRGTNACLWSPGAAVTSTPFLFVSCLVCCFSGLSLYPEPGTFPCLQTISSHREFLGYKILFQFKAVFEMDFRL